MTTNRMGLEQTLSDEQVKELGETLRSWQDGYDPISDKEQYHLFANTITALNELLARRDASSEPVADVVAWNKPGEERKCDIRWRRFDVAPGPLFAAPPIQAVTVPDEPTDDERLMEIEGVSVVKLPPEFHSEHGVVVQLEKVMAALAVHGIKYERRHQKVVGLRAGIDAIRAEGIDIDVAKINAEKCHK